MNQSKHTSTVNTSKSFGTKLCFPDDEDNFQKSVRSVAIIGKIFGAFPVQGINSTNSYGVYFTFKSVWVAYSLLLILFSLLMFVNDAVIEFMKAKVNKTMITILYSATLGLAVNGFSLLHQYLLFKFSIQWPKLMLKWAEVEENFLGWNKTNLRKHILLLTVVVSTCFLVRKILEIKVFMYEYNEVSKEYSDDNMFRWCLDNNTNQTTFTEYVCMNSYTFIYNIIEEYNYYPLWMAYITWIGVTLSTIAPYVSALFIIAKSMGLSQLFYRFNNKLRNSNIQDWTESDWRIIREKYISLVDFTTFINENMSGIVFATLVTYLYHLLQLALYKSYWAGDNQNFFKIYILFSIGYLFWLMWMVMSHASEVNEESRKSLLHLYQCSTEALCPEAMRFQSVIENAQVGITGAYMMQITRQKLLAVTGFLITYAQLLMELKKS